MLSSIHTSIYIVYNNDKSHIHTQKGGGSLLQRIMGLNTSKEDEQYYATSCKVRRPWQIDQKIFVLLYVELA